MQYTLVLLVHVLEIASYLFNIKGVLGNHMANSSVLYNAFRTKKSDIAFAEELYLLIWVPHTSHRFHSFLGCHITLVALNLVRAVALCHMMLVLLSLPIINLLVLSRHTVAVIILAWHNLSGGLRQMCQYLIYTCELTRMSIEDFLASRALQLVRLGLIVLPDWVHNSIIIFCFFLRKWCGCFGGNTYRAAEKTVFAKYMATLGYQRLVWC